MPYVGASGNLGVAFEASASPNTYVAPTAFFNVRNESLGYVEDRIPRRPLRGHADLVGFKGGNVRIEGDIDIEVTEDRLPYLLWGARGAVTKTNVTTDFKYVYVPGQSATAPNATLSITVTKGGVAFGFVGCVVSSQSYTLDNGLLVGTFSILGSNEASQSVPTPAFSTEDVYGPGQYRVEIPTATQVFDTDTFTFTINDNAEAQYRLNDVSRGARYIKFGEREVSAEVERDFENRTEYDIYKAATAQSITISATKAANKKVTFLTPSAIIETHEVGGLSGQANLIRSRVRYVGAYNAATSRAAQITVDTTADITAPM
jgi:hypothetical protein